jgi:cytochrome c peroxidase
MRIVLAVAIVGCSSSAPPMTMAALGKAAFEDQSLSQPAGQACADCHAAASAFRDPESDYSTSRGAIATRFGPRNAPTAMYARFIPPLHQDAALGFVGGLFWDGRVDSLEEQASKPLLNPLEMNAADTPLVRDPAALAHLTDEIAAYERTDELAPFASKYDRYVAGTDALTDSEQRGLAIFTANCASCHPPPLFTDFSYANLGIPKYMNSQFLLMPPELNPDGAAYIDHGLMKTVGDPAQDGKFRVPTLRNIARTAPYGHNGYFENLPYLLDFLNTRDVGSPTNGAWGPPEVAANVDPRVGHLGLTAQDLVDLAAFLGTLSDP